MSLGCAEITSVVIDGAWGKSVIASEPRWFDADTPQPTDQQFVAVWSAPDRATIEMLEQGIAASGWYGYFDQVNARAELHDPSEVIGMHVAM